MSNRNSSYYYSYILCSGAGTMHTSNCKFLNADSPVYKIPTYNDYIKEPLVSPVVSNNNNFLHK